MSGKPKRGQEVDLRIEALDERAQGLATLVREVGDRERSWRVRVPLALPGERIRGELTRVRKREAGARIDSLVEPAPDRIEPRCRHHGRPEQLGPACGGCALQSWPYPRQLEHKADLVRRLLDQAGLDAARVAAPIGCDPPWYYRNKMEYSFGPGSGGPELGLYPRGYKYEVLGLQECFLQSPESAALVPRLGVWARERGLEAHLSVERGGLLRTVTIREGKRTGERLVELTTAGPGEAVARDFLERLLAEAGALGAAITSVYWTVHRAEKGARTTVTEHLLHGDEVLHEELHIGDRRLRFEVHPRAFFQPNTRQAEVLYAEVARAAGADLRGHVLDLYCGTGTIGLSLAHGAERVTGIELQPDAVANARRSAALNGVTNATFHAGDVAKVLAEQSLGGEVDLVVVDPPRSGLHPAAHEQLEATGARHLVYVSCNPASLARDASMLRPAGWTLESVQPVDMFPHTAHIESVARLKR